MLLEPSSLGLLAALCAWPEVRTLIAHVIDAMNLCLGSRVVPLLAASITSSCHRSLQHPLPGSKLPPHLLIELRLDDGVLDELVRVDLSEGRLLRKISIALSEGELLLKLRFVVQLQSGKCPVVFDLGQSMGSLPSLGLVQLDTIGNREEIYILIVACWASTSRAVADGTLPTESCALLQSCA